MSGKFTHLHVHTQYSLLDGASKINELVKRTKELGMDSIAITDHGVLYGIVDFYKECMAQGIKPILGFEAYVTQDMDKKEGSRGHLILLAKNNVGLQNLFVLCSEAFTRGFYVKPRIDYDFLQQHCEGIICLSACVVGDIPTYLLADRYDEAKALALRLKGMFGDDFYIEIQNHGLAEQIAVLPKLVSLARELDIKLVATNDIHYIEKEDAKYQDVLLCIQTNTYIDDENRMRMSADEFYLKTPDEMALIFKDYPEAITNTAEVAEKCNVEMNFSSRHMPEFTAPNGMGNEEFLRMLCNEGLKQRNLADNQTARERLDYEISVISQMGFVDYFLIVYDFIRFARENSIVIGPGRGSGVGSLVAYCLRITDIDPLKYNLLFERLLNPERVSMPDIDVDMCIERRQEVMDYVADKYGHDHVSQIVSFGTLKAKAVVKDVGRVMHMSPDFNNKLSALIPRELDITLKKALAESKELRDFVDSDENASKIMEYAMHLEGLPRHPSTHAAGVVIAPKPLTEFIPLHITRNASGGYTVSTQFAKETVEEMGLLKMDFLGLRTLTVIRYILELIEKNGKPVPDLDAMSYDDKNVYDMISKGDTTAVFQLESPGMRQFMTQLQPDCLEDIIAGISLYRPGPMKRIPDYLKGKFDRESVVYPDERLRPILEPTYGTMVYQEQVMQIVRDLAGYSMGRSDLVRRAMAKKKHDVMVQERYNFINGIDENGEVKVLGAIRNGVAPEVAEKIFDEMMDFASYAFNKSHAAAYAVVAYKTAYLKYYYPYEFMTATINSFLGNVDTVAEYTYFCQSIGIKILPPDINRSDVKFTTEGEAIRVGLIAIKNAGTAVAQIVEERNKNGDFTSFSDFVNRVAGLNKRMVESMIKAGAFSSLGVTRSGLLTVYETAIDRAANERDKRSGGQVLLFDLFQEDTKEQNDIVVPDIQEYDDETLSTMEKATLGLYITSHPLKKYMNIVQSMKHTASHISSPDEQSEIDDGYNVSICGVIQSVRKKRTKSGNTMILGTLEDLSGVVEIVAYPAIYARYMGLLTEEKVVCIKGKVSMNEERGNAVIIDEVIPIENLVQQHMKLFLKFTPQTKHLEEEAIGILRKYPGKITVIFYDDETKKAKRAPESMYVCDSRMLLEELEKHIGKDNVKLVRE